MVEGCTSRSSKVSETYHNFIIYITITSLCIGRCRCILLFCTGRSGRCILLLLNCLSLLFFWLSLGNIGLFCWRYIYLITCKNVISERTLDIPKVKNLPINARGKRVSHFLARSISDGTKFQLQGLILMLSIVLVPLSIFSKTASTVKSETWASIIYDQNGPGHRICILAYLWHRWNRGQLTLWWPM